MELLDRYIAAVKSSLPASQRDDIAAEISIDLEAQVEDREAQLGRPLTQEELAEILKAYGHPRIVASRYWATQHLIGPMLLPFYWSALKLVLSITAFIALTFAALNIAGGNTISEAATAWSRFWTSMLAAFGLVTLVFAIIERTASRGTRLRLDRWNPRTLPPAAALDHQRYSTISSVFEIVFSSIALFWLVEMARTGIPAFFNTVSASGKTVEFTAGREIHALLVPAIVVITLYLASIIAFLVRPALMRMRVFTRLLFNVLLIAASGFLIFTGALITIAGHPDATNALTLVLRISFAFAALVAAWEIWCDIRILHSLAGRTSINSAPVAIP